MKEENTKYTSVSEIQVLKYYVQKNMKSMSPFKDVIYLTLKYMLLMRCFHKKRMMVFVCSTIYC